MSRTHFSRRRRAVGAAVGITLLTGGVAALPSTPAAAISQIQDAQGLDDLDARAGRVAPSAAALSDVSSMGARASWNRFGTPRSLISADGGYLATGLSSNPVTAAMSFLTAHKTAFRLTSAGLSRIELVSDSPMRGTPGHAVILRQKFGTLPSTQDGLITVGVTGGKIAYVSSSAAGDGTTPGAATLSPTDAWLKAAANVGRTVPSTAISGLVTKNGWTLFNVAGFTQEQRARLVAFPTYTEGTRPAYEVNVVDVKNGSALAVTEYIDAQTGKVWFRNNRADENQQASAFNGTLAPPTGCGPLHAYTVDAATKSIDVVASATIPSNDIVLNLIHNAVVVASSDSGTSPEAVHYTGTAGVVDPGVYNVQVCPYRPPTVPFVAPYTYSGVFSSNDTGNPSVANTPQWKSFKNAPPLTYSSTDTRITSCWPVGAPAVVPAGCQRDERNTASRSPWDQVAATNTPSFTTLGNNAATAESWFSPLSPGPLGQRPVSPTRQYTPTWTNQWYTSKCNPAVFASPQRNDVEASVTNLFVGHNRFHDFSYFLGFTEQNFNAQTNNFGNTAPGPYPLGREDDPEVGNAQAGAVSGGSPSYLGRDNANQITLQDGITPITNQYLFQPIAGAFYAPCVDGDYDTTVFGHEYTHLISNRMVAGPDSGLSGYQPGSMGESWSDQVALEYLMEFGYTPQNGENPWALGPYVTGNKNTGIRNYALNNNPLNYSDLGYDITGPEVHADGEVWNAVAYDIRQALVAKYNAAYPAGSASLQLSCAKGERPATLCPGNRRWLQIVFDAFLLQSSDTTMLDARDAYLAADLMRFGGANSTELWREFARNGMGQNASTVDAADNQPVVSFETPRESNEKTVTFVARAEDVAGQPALTNAKFFIGEYEARVTPVADSDPATSLSATAKIVPGTYTVTVQAPGYGIKRYTLNAAASTTSTFTAYLATNLASSAKGATATGTGGTTTAARLIDDTEATSWNATGGTATPDSARGQTVTVDLAGTAPVTVRSAVVSAFTEPKQSRFEALRHFAIDACNAAVSNCALPTSFTQIYESPKAAFPATLPRPLAPDLLRRGFPLPATQATHLRLRVLDNQCTGGPAYQGEQDNDPTNATDCTTGSAHGQTVRAGEFEVFGTGGTSTSPTSPIAQDPVVAFAKVAPATVKPGATLAYTLKYANLGPNPSTSVTVTDALPTGVSFVSASPGGTYNATTRKVTWSLGTVAVAGTGQVTLTVTVPTTAKVGSQLLNTAEFTAALTTATPGAALTLVAPL
jgi:extracellular elastinolytic metalloproteinase